MGASKISRLGNALRTWLQRPEAAKPRPLQLRRMDSTKDVQNLRMSVASFLPSEAVLAEEERELTLPAACFAKPISVDDKEYMPGVYNATVEKDWAEDYYQDLGDVVG